MGGMKDGIIAGGGEGEGESFQEVACLTVTAGSASTGELTAESESDSDDDDDDGESDDSWTGALLGKRTGTFGGFASSDPEEDEESEDDDEEAARLLRFRFLFRFLGAAGLTAAEAILWSGYGSSTSPNKLLVTYLLFFFLAALCNSKSRVRVSHRSSEYSELILWFGTFCRLRNRGIVKY